MKKGPKKTVSVIMPLELYNALKDLAAKDERSMPSYIRLALQKHIGQKNSVPPQRDGTV